MINSVANSLTGTIFLEGGIGFGSLVNSVPVYDMEQNLGEWWVAFIWDYVYKEDEKVSSCSPK